MIPRGFFSSAPAAPDQAIDGFNAVTGDSVGSIVSGNLTTANAGDVIVVLIHGMNTAGGTRTISGVTKTGGTGTVGTFTQQFSTSFLDNNVDPNDYEIWTAVASTTLTNAQFTATVAASSIFHACSMIVFGATHTNTSTPIDADGFFSAHSSGGTQNTPSVGSVNIAASKSMLIGFFSCSSIPADGGANPSTTDYSATGYTKIVGSFDSNGSACQAEFKKFTGAQSGLTTAFTASLRNWTMIAFALRHS